MMKDTLDESIFTSENIVSFIHWLVKFRKKIIAIFLLPLIFAVVVYFFSDYILIFLTLPLKGLKLFFMTPVDGVMTKISIAFFGGIVLAFPFNLYIIASIFSSKISKKLSIQIYFTIPFITAAFVGGGIFAYELILPTTIDFLINCGSTVLKPVISGSEYVSFVAFFILTVGLIFDLPFVMVVMSRFGLIQSEMLRKKRRIAILITFILLAILTPTPDAFTLLAASLPVLFLYELSIWWVYILEKRKKGKRKKYRGNTEQDKLHVERRNKL